MKLSVNRFNEAVTFSNKQFFTDNSLENFIDIQPKVYRYPEVYANKHYIYENENHEIVGLIGTYPASLGSLKLLGIGTVCVDSEYRNKGIMTHLFNEISEDIKDQYDLLYLSGDKLRYENYGFYKTGRSIQFSISIKSFKSDYRKLSVSLYNEESKEITEKLYNLYSLENFIISRNVDRFYDCIKTHKSEIYLLTLNNDIVAYLVYQKKSKLITELIYKDVLLEEVLFNFMNEVNLNQVYCQVSLNHKDIQKYYRYSSKSDLSVLMNIRVDKYCNLISYFLNQKTDLIHGELRIKIDNKVIRIVVTDEISVQELENSYYDIELTHFEMHTLLFDFYFIFNTSINVKQEIIKSWFPFYLPATLSNIDSF